VLLKSAAVGRVMCKVFVGLYVDGVVHEEDQKIPLEVD
jgi:hypothetical protein